MADKVREAGCPDGYGDRHAAKCENAVVAARVIEGAWGDGYIAGRRAALDAPLAAPSGGDATPRDEAGGTLPTRGDVGRPEATRDPVFLLRYRHPKDSPDKNRWHVDSVWFTREEAEQFAANHAHRWGKDKHGPRWHVYCLPANGDLAALLKTVTHRDASLRGKEAPRG